MITGFVNSGHEAIVRLTVLGPMGQRADGMALLAEHEITIQVTPGGDVAIRPIRTA